ncbi:MAG: hypothetical protein ABR579_05280 [Actinomycetota bacterium]
MLHDDPRNPFSEAVGVVQGSTRADGGATLQIVTRKRGVVTVDCSDILALKVFP